LWQNQSMGNNNGNLTTTTIGEPDFDMANRFLDALTGGSDEAVTFQFFDDTKKNKNLAEWKHLKRNSGDLDVLLKKQKQGCGVYVMVNKGNGKGRNAKNVVKVRALFIDLDGSPWEPVAELLKPHIRVESSPGRYHLCWLVSDCSLEQFKPLQQAIARKFDGDKVCVDLCRVLRVPGFYHLKKQPVMSRLVELNTHDRYTTKQIIDGLRLVLDEPETTSQLPTKQHTAKQTTGHNVYEYTNTDTGEIIDLTAWAAKNPSFNIVAAIAPQYARGQIKDGKQHITCPFSHEHTDTGADLSTFVVNASPPEHRTFVIHCMHNHCTERDRLQFLEAMLNQRMLSSEILQAPAALPPKRPQKIFYPVNEIASILQLRSLSHDEFRVVLHLMHLSWAAEDGTLPDDDWMLARSLGLSEAEWQGYRNTLIRTGWLTADNGRLYNPIIKREFDNAQTALDNFRAKGQKGGKKAQENKHSSSCA